MARKTDYIGGRTAADAKKVDELMDMVMKDTDLHDEIKEKSGTDIKETLSSYTPMGEDAIWWNIHLSFRNKDGLNESKEADQYATRKEAEAWGKDWVQHHKDAGTLVEVLDFSVFPAPSSPSTAAFTPRTLDYSGYKPMDDIKVKGKDAIVLTNDPDKKKIVVEYLDGEVESLGYSDVAPESEPPTRSGFIDFWEGDEKKRGTPMIHTGGKSRPATDKEKKEVAIQQNWNMDSGKYEGWALVFLGDGSDIWFKTEAEAKKYIKDNDLTDETGNVIIDEKGGKLAKGGGIGGDYSGYKPMDDIKVKGKDAIVLTNDPDKKKIVVEYLDGEVESLGYSDVAATPTDTPLREEGDISTHLSRGEARSDEEIALAMQKEVISSSGSGRERAVTDKEKKRVYIQEHYSFHPSDNERYQDGWLVYAPMLGVALGRFHTKERAQEWVKLKGLEDISSHADFAKGGKAKGDKNWIQSAEKEMEKKGTVGAFTKQSKRAGMSTEAFAKEVLANPTKFHDKTRKRAQFFKNVQPEDFSKGGGMSGLPDIPPRDPDEERKHKEDTAQWDKSVKEDAKEAFPHLSDKEIDKLIKDIEPDPIHRRSKGGGFTEDRIDIIYGKWLEGMRSGLSPNARHTSKGIDLSKLEAKELADKMGTTQAKIRKWHNAFNEDRLSYADGGEVEQSFNVGDMVELSENGWDNENYQDFFNGKDDVRLRITDVYKSVSEHQGYDISVGQALYATEIIEDTGNLGEVVPFDLYDWELELLEGYADGGEIDADVKVFSIEEMRKSKTLTKQGAEGLFMPIFNKGSKTAFGFIKTPQSLIDGRHLGNIKARKLKNGKIKIEYGKEYYADGGEIENLIKDGNVIFSKTKKEHSDIYGIDSDNPLFIQHLCIDTNKREKGLGKKVIDHIEDYAIRNNHDLIFGHISAKSKYGKKDICDAEKVKSWLVDKGYNIAPDTNDFYKKLSYAEGGEVKSEDIKKGTKVFWKDPSGETHYSDRVWIIQDYNGDLEETVSEADFDELDDLEIMLKSEDGMSEAGVYYWELVYADDSKGGSTYAEGGSIKKSGYFKGALSFLNW